MKPRRSFVALAFASASACSVENPESHVGQVPPSARIKSCAGVANGPKSIRLEPAGQGNFKLGIFTPRASGNTLDATLTFFKELEGTYLSGGRDYQLIFLTPVRARIYKNGLDWGAVDCVLAER